MTYAPPESAVVRAHAPEPDPDAWITPEMRLLREIDYGIRVLAWQRTEDATKHEVLQQHRPERVPLTVAELAEYEARHAPEYDAMTLEEAADFLGWERPEPKGA